jgi:hypothetical protein
LFVSVVACRARWWRAEPCFLIQGSLDQGYLRSSGKRGLAIQNEHVLVMRVRSERVILFLEPNKLGFQVANTLL